MKKLVIVALAAVLSFGSAVPAFAAGPHHKQGQCLDYSEVCHRMAQNVITPGLQSVSERLSAVLAQVNPGYAASAAGSQQVDAYATSPSLCANGACEMYLDSDGDGICDYHGADCPNLGSSASSGANAGSGYGNHHNSGHHGGYHH